jgi:nucleoside 2-deoxyribosyltransferase
MSSLRATKQNIYKIYCAGPLFNPKEREDMEEIASVLEKHNFEVFLPHRDGLEFAHFYPLMLDLKKCHNEASSILKKAIFYLDIYHVLASDGLVLNMNGRVPDEGAMVEVGVGWSAGKAIVIFKDDVRTLIDGNDNPLVVGLADFNVINNKNNIPACFNKLFERNRKTHEIDVDRLKQAFEIGRKVYHLTKEEVAQDELCEKLINVIGGSNVLQVARGQSLF